VALCASGGYPGGVDPEIQRHHGAVDDVQLIVGEGDTQLPLACGATVRDEAADERAARGELTGSLRREHHAHHHVLERDENQLLLDPQAEVGVPQTHHAGRCASHVPFSLSSPYSISSPAAQTNCSRPPTRDIIA
jgi:hypothetical protein